MRLYELMAVTEALQSGSRYFKGVLPTYAVPPAKWVMTGSKVRPTLKVMLRLAHGLYSVLWLKLRRVYVTTNLAPAS